MKKLLLIPIALLIGNLSYAQLCEINITTTPSQVCPGTPISLNANGFVTGDNYSFNFNVGTLPAGWSTTGGTNFSSNICGQSLDGTNYFWASTASGTPQIVTDGFDICSGGTLKFDMKYAIQGRSAPCEGPDLANEGVSIEYKVGGGPWVEFIYYRPDGTVLTNCPSGTSPSTSGNTPFTTWKTYTVPIPANAVSTNTKFRWIQYNSSGSCCDNWGLDNIFINAGPCIEANIDWSNGAQNSANTSIIANTDTCMVAYLYDVDNNFLCESTPVCFTVFNPNINGGNDQTVCAGDQVTLSASGGTGFTWDNGVINETPFTAVSSQMYHVSGTDLNGCLATDSVMVFVNPVLETTISYAEIAYCNSETNPAPTVTVSNAGTFSISPATMNINATTGVLDLASSIVSPSETYTITYTPSEACLSSSNFDVTVYSLPNATITSDITVCQNDADPILTLTGSNATAPYVFSYNVNGGATQTVTSTGDSFSLPASTDVDGDFIYTITSVSESGDEACSNTMNESVTVTVRPAPVFTVTPSQAICFGDSIALTASGATSYIWSDGLENGVIFSPDETATYTVTATGTNNCTGAQTVTVTVNSLPEIDAGADQNACLGTPVILSGSEGVSYEWTGGVTNNQPFNPPLGNNTYYVIGTDANGCKNIDSVLVKVIEPVVAGIGADVTTGYPGLNVNFSNNSLYGNYFQWDFGNGFTSTTTTSVGQSSSYPNSGVYDAIITAYNGVCEDTAMITITVLPFPDPIIEIPNVFTPNGDNVNDVWWIDVQWGKSIMVQIFNRWGNLMTEMDDFNDRWDGQNNAGNDATDGVYFYKYVLTDLNDKLHEGHGHLTIER